MEIFIEFMRLRLLLINILTISVLSAAAQPQHHTFYSFTKEDGLTSSTIQDMVQDRNGFLWLASWGGLYRFDGDRFVNYRADIPDEQGNPRSNRFIQVEEDGFGRIWALAYDHILYYIDPGQASLCLAQHSPRKISRIFPLRSGRICLNTQDNLLLFPEGDGSSGITFSDSRLIPSGALLQDIFQDKRGYLWLLTDQGLYREGTCLDPSPAFCFLEMEDRLLFGSSEGRILVVDSQGISSRQTRLRSEISLLAGTSRPDEFLAGSTGEGIVLCSADGNRENHVGKISFAGGRLGAVTNSQGELWIYSGAGGLDWYDSVRQVLVPFFNPARQQGWSMESRVACVLIDSQDDLWISSALGGLEEAVFSREPFRFRSFAPQGFVSAGSSVRSMCELAPGRLLAGTRDGTVYELDTLFNKRVFASLPAPPYALMRDSAGTIWAGTRAEGLFEIHPDTGRMIGFRKNDDYYGAIADHIYWLEEDARHRLWIASFDGSLSYLDLGQESRPFISKKNRLSFPSEEQHRLRCVVFGPDGTLYTSSDIGMFACKNVSGPPEEMQFLPFPRLHNYDIPDILISRQGVLYVCSYGNGFLRMDHPDPSSGFQTYSVEDGLLSNFILSAAEDRNGIIWIATEGGLNRFDPLSGNIVSYSYERLGYPMRFNEGRILETSDGKLCFNANSGIFYFDPEQVSNSSYVPRLQLLSCAAGKRPQDPDDGEIIRLRAGEQLQLGFVAIDMAAPGHVHYAYRIDGTDDDWVSIGTQHELTLGPFRRGRHQVLLRSTNGAGVTVDNVRTLEIQALPHPLASTPAVICYLLCAVTAGMVLLLRRRRRPEGPVAPENPYLRGLQGDDRKLIEALLALLESKLDDGALDMDAMAEEMHLSRSALFKKTKALTGKSPMDLLHEMRSARARELVASGGYTIAQIAYMTGFNDAHYFSRIFKKETGMTPTEYRNQNNTQP